MKIAYLVDRQVFERKMSRVRFQQIQAISGLTFERSRTPVLWSGPGWENWDGALSPSKNVERLRMGDAGGPELIVTYKVGPLADCGLPVVEQFNEAYDHRVVDQEVQGSGVGIVVFHHVNDVPHYAYWDNLGIRRLHLPHCADTAIYRDYGLDKDIDVLVAGNLNDYYYPFRYRLMLLAKHYFARRGWRVKILQHPGYELPPREGTYVGEAFARLMNRSKLVFTCAMRYHYALAKYCEIALCRSLAVADVPDERQDFFRATILALDPSMTDAEICRRVEEYLDDDNGLRQTHTTVSYDRNRQTSTMEHYAERFVQAMVAFVS